MSVAMMIDNPEGSQEIYERIREQLSLEKPAGGIFHAAGPSPNGGWRVIEVWESEEQAKRFVDERLLPAFEAAGASPPPPPQLWPIHSHMAQRGEVAATASDRYGWSLQVIEESADHPARDHPEACLHALYGLLAETAPTQSRARDASNHPRRK